MTNPSTGPRFRMAPGTVLRGSRRPPLPESQPTAEPGDPGTPSAPTAPDGSATSSAPAPRPSDAPTGFRNTLHDRASLAVSVDPVWLLAPLYARDAAGLTVPGDGPGRVAPAVPDVPVTDAVTDLEAAASDWPAWWAAALAYRPGTPAPRQRDLIAGSVALHRLWIRLEPGYDRWLAARPAHRPDADIPARSVERAALAGFAAATGREPGRWTVRILEIPVTGSYLHSPEPRRIVVSATLRADPDRYRDALAAELPRHF